MLFYEDAEVSFKKVIELDPDNAEIWLDYANLLFEQENKNGSLEIPKLIIGLPMATDTD